MVKTGNRPLDSGRVLDLRMNEGAGSVVRDVSGERNHGSIVGASWVDGKYGKALDFNGSTDYVEVATSPSLDAMTELTLLLSLKTNDYTENQRVVQFYKDPNDRVELWLTASLIEVFNHINAAAVGFRSTSHPSDGVFCQLGLTIDNAGNWKVLFNGSIETERTYTEKISDLDDGFKITIGNREAHDQATNGVIDEVLIYNRVLNPEETKLQYASRGRQ